MPRDTSKSLHKLCVIREKLEYRHFVSCILNFCSPSKSHTPLPSCIICTLHPTHPHTLIPSPMHPAHPTHHPHPARHSLHTAMPILHPVLLTPSTPCTLHPACICMLKDDWLYLSPHFKFLIPSNHCK